MLKGKKLRMYYKQDCERMCKNKSNREWNIVYTSVVNKHVNVEKFRSCNLHILSLNVYEILISFQNVIYNNDNNKRIKIACNGCTIVASNTDNCDTIHARWCDEQHLKISKPICERTCTYFTEFCALSWRLRHTALVKTSDQPVPNACTCPTHNSHTRQTFMSPAGFEPTISASELPHTHTLDPAATGIGEF